MEENSVVGEKSGQNGENSGENGGKKSMDTSGWRDSNPGPLDYKQHLTNKVTGRTMIPRAVVEYFGM